MPAAKIEKTNSVDQQPDVEGKTDVNNNTNANINCYQESIKVANTIIEKKIRNLEKRKARLLDLKASEDKGQVLQQDQVIAVKKLDGVVEMIDILKDINKSVSDSLTELGKQYKKLQKKESQDKHLEKQQRDSESVKLWFSIQCFVNLFNTDPNALKNQVKEDLKLSGLQVKAIQKFVGDYVELNLTSIQTESDKITFLLEGNKKEFVVEKITYFDLKNLFVKLSSSEKFQKLSFITETEEKPLVKESQTDGGKVSKAKTPRNKKDNTKPEKVVPEQQQTQPPATSIETELHNDPAVVAVASSDNFSYLAQPTFSTTMVSNPNVMTTPYPHIYHPQVPSQTFTNQNYAPQMIVPNQFIPIQMIPGINQQQVYAGGDGEQQPVLPQQPNVKPASPIDPAAKQAVNGNKSEKDLKNKTSQNGNGDQGVKPPLENGHNNKRAPRGGPRFPGKQYAQQGGGYRGPRNNHNGPPEKQHFGYFNGGQQNASVAPNDAHFPTESHERANGSYNPNPRPFTYRRGGDRHQDSNGGGRGGARLGNYRGGYNGPRNNVNQPPQQQQS